jgi:C-terminal processing protease CtpA/Prc
MTPTARQAPADITAIIPEPIPTPESVQQAAASPTASRVAGLILPATLILFSLGMLATWGKRQWASPKQHLRRKRLIGQGAAVLLCLMSLGCQSPAAEPLSPDDYLDQALNWLEANSVTAAAVDWDTVRAEAMAMAGQPQTTADTYAAIEYAIDQLNDPEAFMTTPDRSVWQSGGLGITAVYPDNIIVDVKAGSPAAKAGIQVNDEVLAINGNPPAPQDNRPHEVDFLYDALGQQTITLTLRRGAEQWEVKVTEDQYTFESQPVSRAFAIGQKTAAYLGLPIDVGTRLYPTDAQAAMAAVDSADTCGWIIDLRHTRGGDLWTYFAALSPILGEGHLGGFVYNDGSEETWRLENGKVFWADEEREESYVRGRRYELERPSPPVALMVGPLTEAAGELVVVAFQGWGTVRTFGEATLGAPHLILHTPLSDGANLYISGARGLDRLGTVYNGPINPDEPLSIVWQHLGDDNDPVISAALDWLATQPACTP